MARAAQLALLAALMALAALSVHAASPAAGDGGGAAHHSAGRRRLSGSRRAGARKLLQPFGLGLGDATRNTENSAREANIINLANGVIRTNLQTRPSVNDSITARTVQTTAGTNLNLAGIAKSARETDVRTDESGASTEARTATATIAQPGFGVTAAQANNLAGSLYQKRTKPAGAPPPPDDDPYTGPNDDRPLGAWDVLLAGARDYGFAGDYDYNLIVDITGEEGGPGYLDNYDYDYGQWRPIPETGRVTTKTATELDRAVRRAAGHAGQHAAATAPLAVSRVQSTATGLFGGTAARQNDDIFGTGTVFIPANPYRQTGSQAFGAAIGRNWKGSLPSAAVNTANAGTTVSENYISGGASNIVTYGHGTKSTVARSTNVALGGQENIDFDVGR